MTSINWPRVISCGLLAGLVMNISQFVLNAVVYAKESEEAMKQMNLQPAGGGAIGFFLFDTFVLGILMVWLYSALRPRYGAGPKTALIVGLVFAFVARLVPSINFGVLGMFPPNLLVVSGLGPGRSAPGGIDWRLGLQGG